MAKRRPEPTYLHVRVQTQAKRESIVTKKPNTYMITVREKAEKGAANRRARELLADLLCVPISRLRLIKGVTSPSKLFLLINNTHHEN